MLATEPPCTTSGSFRRLSNPGAPLGHSGTTSGSADADTANSRHPPNAVVTHRRDAATTLEAGSARCADRTPQRGVPTIESTLNIRQPSRGFAKSRHVLHSHAV